MRNVEEVRFGLFIGVVLLVYALAMGELSRLVLRRFGLIKRSEGRWAVWSRRVVLVLAALGTVCIAYGFFVEPYWPEVTHVRIASPNLDVGARPIRIVHLSDIHSDPKARLEGRLPALVAAERPDLIVFTGDSLNSPDGLPIFRRLMTRLVKIAPTYAVRGNWDVWYWPGLDLFGGTGVRELDSEALEIEVGDSRVWVAGIPVDSEAMLDDVLGLIPDGSLSIFLHHYPDEIYNVAEHRIDLYCAGHIHGGQVALPFYGALMTLAKYGKRFEAGLYRVDETNLYVSRGIGMEGGRMPRVRFCARPEVTLIEIVPSG